MAIAAKDTNQKIITIKSALLIPLTSAVDRLPLNVDPLFYGHWNDTARRVALNFSFSFYALDILDDVLVSFFRIHTSRSVDLPSCKGDTLP